MPKLINLVMIEMVCLVFLVSQTKEDCALNCQEGDIVLEDLVNVFKATSRMIIERYAIVLTFSKFRIQSRLMESISRLGLSDQDEATIAVEKMLCDIEKMEGSIEGNQGELFVPIMSAFISHMGLTRAASLVHMARNDNNTGAEGAFILPIPPQYAISFNEKKFSQWKPKLRS